MRADKPPDLCERTFRFARVMVAFLPGAFEGIWGGPTDRWPVAACGHLCRCKRRRDSLLAPAHSGDEARDDRIGRTAPPRSERVGGHICRDRVSSTASSRLLNRARRFCVSPFKFPVLAFPFCLSTLHF